MTWTQQGLHDFVQQHLEYEELRKQLFAYIELLYELTEKDKGWIFCRHTERLPLEVFTAAIQTVMGESGRLVPILFSRARPIADRPSWMTESLYHSPEFNLGMLNRASRSFKGWHEYDELEELENSGHVQDPWYRCYAGMGGPLLSGLSLAQLLKTEEAEESSLDQSLGNRFRTSLQKGLEHSFDYHGSEIDDLSTELAASLTALAFRTLHYAMNNPDSAYILRTLISLFESGLIPVGTNHVNKKNQIGYLTD